MNGSALLQYAVFLAVVALLVKPVGGHMARVFVGERTFLDPVLRPAERAIYRVTRVDALAEMKWREYAAAFVLFGLAGTLALYAILRLQHWLPWFDAAPMTPDLAANAAVSFATTTTVGTLPTYTPAFGLVLAGTAVVVVALGYGPVRALGPILEHLLMTGG